MSNDLPRAKGLTKVIYQALEAVMLDVVAEGECWTPRLLEQVEQELRIQMSPAGDESTGLIFDMVFQRSFAEAADLFLATLPPQLSTSLNGQSAVNLV